MLTMVTMLSAFCAFFQAFCINPNESGETWNISSVCIGSNVAVVDDARNDEVNCESLDVLFVRFISGEHGASEGAYCEFQERNGILCQDENGNYFLVKSWGNVRDVVALINGEDVNYYRSRFYSFYRENKNKLQDSADADQQKDSEQFANRMEGCLSTAQSECFGPTKNEEYSNYELITDRHIVGMTIENTLTEHIDIYFRPFNSLLLFLYIAMVSYFLLTLF